MFVIIFIALFFFDAWFGGLLMDEIGNLSNSYEKLKADNPKEFRKVDSYYGKEIDKYIHKRPESFPLSLITNLIELIKVSKLLDRVRSSL